jgi:MFS transporter, SHS family, lactate transporter
MAKMKYSVTRHWPIFIYCIVLTACFNCLGHGTMDVYPTFLVTQRHLTVKQETWVTVILQIGGISGGAIGGHLSHKISAKWVAAGFALGVAPFLPLWVLPKSWNLLALGSFLMMFCYGSAIGNLGNILQQMCPHPGLRAAFVGVAYNLGNAISSIAPTVVTRLGEEFPLADGTPNYARTQLIWAGIVSCIACSLSRAYGLTLA